MPNISSCYHIFCPINSCRVWGVERPNEEEGYILFRQYPSRRNVYLASAICPLYPLIACCFHSVDEYRVYDSGLVRYEQKYPCHTDSGTIENVRSLELSEVLLEESTQPRYCLRFRSANEEPFEEVFDSLQYNGYYRVEGSIHKHNVPERQRVVDRVNEFLESKGKLVHKAAHQSSKKAFDDTTLMSNPLVAKRASSRAQKSAPEQQAESSSIQGKTTDESRDFPSSNHVDNPLRQNQDTTESPQGATTESSNSKTGTPAPRRKTMKEIMDARLAS